MHDTIEFFNRLAPKWDEICHHDATKIQTMLNLIPVKEQATILDVGCGTGILETFLLDYAPKSIVAVDVADEMLKRARAKFPQEVIDFRCQDVMMLEKENEGYDHIILYSVFPHFKDPQGLIQHLKTLLAPQGKLSICHSESKEVLNQMHQTTADEVSKGLPPAIKLAEMIGNYLQVEVIVDHEAMYMVSASKQDA